MLSRISELLHSWAKGWLILALIAFFVGYIALTLLFLQTKPGGNIESLDARIFYTPDEAYSTVGSYGDASQFWIRIYLTWDIVNPILYTLILGLSISWLFQRGFASDSRPQMLNIAPVGVGLFDVLENIFIAILLRAYPTRLTAVAWLGTVSTTAKTIFLGASTILILVGLVAATLNRFKNQ
jgi:hypothetical protein